jgi:hypothetical protein
MKKTFLLAFVLFSFASAKCQVNNLADLLQISELSVEGLTENLQGIWELKQPSEKMSDNKKLIIGTYQYVLSSRNQTIERVITNSVNMDYTSERTNFICNDSEVLKRILKTLPYKGYELKQNKPHKKVYHDGNNMVAIIDASTDDVTIPKGYYMICVFLH